MKRLAVVDKARCVACGACVKVCPRNAIRIYRGCYAYVEHLLCVGCGKCTKICPTGCLALEERQAQP